MSSIIQNILFIRKLGEPALTYGYNRSVTSDLTTAFSSLFSRKFAILLEFVP